jgi:hypothetical protein
MSTIPSALFSLRPNASWQLHDPNDFSTLEWLDKDTTPPTLEEIHVEQARLDVETANNAYKEKRQREYPSFIDYLDGVVKGDQAQIDKYIADCNAVKAKYPKG